MAEIVTTEYHTYKYIGDQTLIRDDGVWMRCTSLANSVFTLKKDLAFYTPENWEDFEEVLIYKESANYVSYKVYRKEYTQAFSTPSYTTKVLAGSHYVYLDAYNYIPMAVRYWSRQDYTFPQINRLWYNTTDECLQADTGYGATISGASYLQLKSDGTQVFQNTSDGGSITETWDPTEEYVANTASTTEIDTNAPPNVVVIDGEMMTGTIDQMLTHFDYNSGGCWEEIILDITKVRFTGQGTDTTYDLEEATENYKVLGIVGNTVTIQIDDHKTVTHTYEDQVGEVTLNPSGDTLIVTATTKSDPSDVTCQLYQCSADPRVVDKTDYLTNIQQLSGSWVVPFDEMAPVLRINLANNLVTSGNYCRIYSAGWGTKYYFIKNRVCVGQEVWDLYLEEDVLMTFKSYFKTSTGLIDRSESAYNLLIPDSTIPLEVGQNVTVREITNDVFSDNYGYNYVLTGLLVGGETK